MLPIYIFALFGISMLLIGDDQQDDTVDEPEVDPDTGAYLVRSGQTLVGTDGEDEFNLAEDTLYSDGPVSITAGAGNDSIDLLDYVTDGVNIDAGDGNDFVRVDGVGLSIEGGAGDDDMIFFNGPAHVYGGEGRDLITSNAVFTDHSEFYGGAGDDVLDGRDMDNVGLFGGEGNDLLMTSGHQSAGAGYWTHAYGGAGDDTIVHEAPAQIPDATVPSLTGGAGTDSFEISFTEAAEDSGFDAIPTRSEFVVLTDFEIGVDQIQIDAQVSDTSYTVASAQLVEDTEAGMTQLVVHYDAPDAEDADPLPDRDMVVVIHATGVTWDDVNFVGGHQPLAIAPLA